MHKNGSGLIVNGILWLKLKLRVKGRSGAIRINWKFDRLRWSRQGTTRTQYWTLLLSGIVQLRVNRLSLWRICCRRRQGRLFWEFIQSNWLICSWFDCSSASWMCLYFLFIRWSNRSWIGDEGRLLRVQKSFRLIFVWFFIFFLFFFFFL